MRSHTRNADEPYATYPAFPVPCETWPLTSLDPGGEPRSRVDSDCAGQWLPCRAKLLAHRVPSHGMSITLYALDGCPYCEKVHDALEDGGIDYDTVWVEALHSERNEVKRVSGQRGVPVLVDDDHGVTMAESDNVLQYVDRTLA